MDKLSGLDATFLYLETPETPMHVGSFCLYELPPNFKGSFHKALKAHLKRRLHLVPIFTRKLKNMPLELGHPVWIPDDHVDLDFHIQKIKAATLTVLEAEAMCAHLHGQLMDRSRPLWEFHVFEHLVRPDGSPCAGVYSKVHHAALDGKGGTVLTQAIMDVTEQPRKIQPTHHRRVSADTEDPGTSTMIGEVLSNSLAQYKALFKALPQAARAFGRTVVKQSLGGTGAKAQPQSPIHLAPMTQFNVAVTPERTFGTARIPFAECRAMAKAVGASFNDIVLWICATALRDYLGKQGQLPKKSLLAAMPISLREEGNQDLNTQASMTVVELGTQYAHPVKRLQAILRSTAKVKVAMADLKGLIPTNYPSLLAPWVVGGVAKAAFKTYQATGLSHRLPMLSNLVISNVPGPQVPLYLAGAKLLTYHPMSIVVHGTALNITIQTYAGWVDFGVIADKSAVPDVQALTQALVQAFEEGRRLLLAPPEPSQTAPRKATVKKTGSDLVKRLNKSSAATKTKRPALQTKDSATPTPSLSATVKKLANTIKRASLT